MMDNLTVPIIAGVVLVGFLVMYLYSYKKDKKELTGGPTVKNEPPPSAENAPSKQMQLAAYERLVILADRIALPNLVSRVSDPSYDKVTMQGVLTQSIKQEFEYNLSQQIYVSNEAWEAIRNLKEQNVLIVNQLGAILPNDISGPEFGRKIVEFIMNQPQGSMHTLVQEALSYEAKKLLA